MKAIDFIQADLQRQASGRGRILIPAILAAAMAAIGLGLRRDFLETFSMPNLVPAALILVALGALYSLGRKPLVAGSAIAIALGLSLVQPQTSISLAKFAPPASFWPETLHCLALGVASSLVASLLLAALTTRLRPAPDRRAQLLCATVASLAGLAALSFHCMGPLVGHTLIAHWGQGLVVFPVAYAVTRAVFARQMKRAIGSDRHVRDLARLGD
jgi:hypothetical protein